MADKHRPRKSLPKPKGPNPFRRAPRLPDRMQGSAELWLELFMDFSSRLIDDATGNALSKLDTAKELADRALEIYETRWPGAKL